jgi:periplasmic copper chaperone A
VARGIFTPRRLVPSLFAGLFAAAATSCSGTPSLRIENPEAKVSPALVGVCAIFMRIANAGDGDDALLDAQLELPGTVTQLHAIRDGRMVHSERLVVPARGALELRPGGPHIMVFQLPEAPGAGCDATVRLRFETSGERRAAVRLGGLRCG